jgi:hypothetical protein
MDLRRSAALMRLASVSLATMFIALSPATARAQASGVLSVYGRVSHPSDRHQSGDHVLTYDSVTRRWIGPALTDNDGRFAFYDLVAGRSYVLALYVSGRPVWQNQIEYRGIPLNFTIVTDK